MLLRFLASMYLSFLSIFSRLYAQPGSLNCPVRLTLSYFSFLGLDYQGSVVPQCQPSDRMKPHLTRSLSYTNAVEDLRYILRKIGIDPRGYSEHSMRRGGATEAARSGASTDEIQIAGDWASLRTAEKYVDASYKRSKQFNQYLV